MHKSQQRVQPLSQQPCMSQQTPGQLSRMSQQTPSQLLHVSTNTKPMVTHFTINKKPTAMHVSSKTKQQSDKPQQKQTQQSPRIEEVRIVKIVLRNRPPRDKYGAGGKKCFLEWRRRGERLGSSYTVDWLVTNQLLFWKRNDKILC